MPADKAQCIFCRIVAGEIPCHKLIETDAVLAFLDVNPLAPGHALLVPRVHADRLEELSADMAAAIVREIGPLARRVLAAVGAGDYNVLQNNGPASGQVVPHVHFHIIPRRKSDGLGYRWNVTKAEPARLAELARRIAPDSNTG
jgi:diadenosine tetraphosphate (Ap4A) HIT family hydrolase